MSKPAGAIIIEWPAATGRPVVGWAAKITDVRTGEQVKTCSHIEIHCDAHALVTADLTLFTDEVGEPVFDGEPARTDDGDPFTGVFSFAVAEMRTAAS